MRRAPVGKRLDLFELTLQYPIFRIWRAVYYASFGNTLAVAGQGTIFPIE
jgi:hypothetical protein